MQVENQQGAREVGLAILIPFRCFSFDHCTGSTVIEEPQDLSLRMHFGLSILKWCNVEPSESLGRYVLLFLDAVAQENALHSSPVATCFPISLMFSLTLQGCI